MSHVVIGLLGATLDQGKSADRWQNLATDHRPLCRQPDLIVTG